jgi:CRISPR-associated protein Cmr1
VAWPESETATVDALKLIHWFGSIGGRSRNGWGSLAFDHGIESTGIPDASDPLIGKIATPLGQCLTKDWPHALGKDERPFVWKSKEFETWRDAMTTLAKAKIGFRTEPLKFTKPNGQFDERHVLSYPVTHHSVHAWGNQARLANQLRFKVAKTANGKFVAVIFHLPCALPHELAQKLGPIKPSLEQQAAIWSRVHAWLDASASGFQRI